MRSPLVRIKHFGVLKGVEVGLAPLTILIGPNGTGKSTLLRGLSELLSFRVKGGSLELETPAAHWMGERIKPVELCFKHPPTANYRLGRLLDELAGTLSSLEAAFSKINARGAFEALLQSNIIVNSLTILARMKSVIEVSIDFEAGDRAVKTRLNGIGCTLSVDGDQTEVDPEAGAHLTRILAASIRPLWATYEGINRELDTFVPTWAGAIEEKVRGVLEDSLKLRLISLHGGALEDTILGFTVDVGGAGSAAPSFLAALAAMALAERACELGARPSAAPTTLMENVDSTLYGEVKYMWLAKPLIKHARLEGKSPILLETQDASFALTLKQLAKHSMLYLFVKNREGGSAIPISIDEKGAVSLPEGEREEVEEALASMGLDEDFLMADIKRRSELLRSYLKA